MTTAEYLTPDPFYDTMRPFLLGRTTWEEVEQADAASRQSEHDRCRHVYQYLNLGRLSAGGFSNSRVRLKRSVRRLKIACRFKQAVDSKTRL